MICSVLIFQDNRTTSNWSIFDLALTMTIKMTRRQNLN